MPSFFISDLLLLPLYDRPPLPIYDSYARPIIGIFGFAYLFQLSLGTSSTLLRRMQLLVQFWTACNMLDFGVYHMLSSANGLTMEFLNLQKHYHIMSNEIEHHYISAISTLKEIEN
mmetsp:Transcript_30124/g.42695  ORF Transcript_30124/g.42695 Transcript_30124/m.42695 type:complete len:116 (+) Transcript_30124:82-429(+)